MSIILAVALAFVFLLLLAIGLSMRETRRRNLRNAMAIPMVFIVLSYASVVSAFGLLSWAAFTWAMGVVLAKWLSDLLRLWSYITWSAKEKLVILPGSWLPLVLIMSVFLTKFGVGFILAMQPVLAKDWLFTSIVGMVYGSFSGIFLARIWVMWQVARELNGASANDR